MPPLRSAQLSLAAPHMQDCAGLLFVWLLIVSRRSLQPFLLSPYVVHYASSQQLRTSVEDKERERAVPTASLSGFESESEGEAA